MLKHIVIRDTEKQLIDLLIKQWIVIAQQSIAERGYFCVALSGGKTPIPLYKAAASRIPKKIWQKTHFFWVDERWVEPTHEDSNFALVEKLLLKPLKIAAEQIHPVRTVGSAPDESAGKYHQHIQDFFRSHRQSVPRFDLIILGVGEDGHTASLFPEDFRKKPKDSWVVAASSKAHPHQRVSFNLSLLNIAKNIFFLMTGSGKAQTALDIVHHHNNDLPANHVAPKGGQVWYFLDKKAAVKLPEGKM